MKKERYPQTVVASIVNMVDAIEDNLREIIADEIKSLPLPESDPQPKPQQTDMHGEPVAGDSATPMPIYGRRHPKGDPDFWKTTTGRCQRVISSLSRFCAGALWRFQRLPG